MEEQKFDIKLMQGEGQKIFTEMTKAESKKVATEIAETEKRKAFDLGLPIYYGKEGLVIAEYSDGRKFVIENLQVTREYNG